MSMDQAAIGSDPTLRDRITKFFYAEEVPYGMAVVRILLSFSLLVPMVQRWAWARELYSLDGAASPLWFNYGWPDLLPLLPGGVIVAMHTLLIFFLVTSLLGWKTRFSLWVSTILFVYINLCDSVSTITKYSVIASHAMLMLSFSHCGAIWSVDAWLKKRRLAASGDGSSNAETELPRFPIWPQRLVQLMIGIVYFGAAFTKMHTPEFFSGDQLQTWLLTNLNYNNPVGEYLSLFPAILVVFAYITIVWEITFVFLCWRGWSRIIALGLGASFHLMTTLTLGLYSFPMVCISIYFAFIDERAAHKFGVWFAGIREKLGWQPSGGAPKPLTAMANAIDRLRLPSPLGFCLVMLGVTVIGIEAEHRLDHYGNRRADGPHTLKKIEDRELVARMLADPQPMRLKDMFDTFEVGTDFLSGLLLGRRDDFKQGEMVAAQVGLTSPHHDMWLECNLHDSRGNQLDRVGQVVPRESKRANFYYTLDSVLDPGVYFFVLKSGGREVMRRRIVLKPGVKPPVAN